MIIDTLRFVNDVFWELTCTLASIGVCAVVALLAICVVQAVWQLICGR